MKVAYITYAKLLGATYGGLEQTCGRNLQLLRQAMGEENVHVFIITDREEELKLSSERTKVYHSGRTIKKLTLKNGFAALGGREKFSKKAESSILKEVIRADFDAVFLET